MTIATRPPPKVSRVRRSSGAVLKDHTSWPRSARPGTRFGAGFGAERHDQPLALEVSDARLHGTPGWIDGGDVGLDDLDPTSNQGGTRAAPLFDRPQPHELPELAETHREGRLTVDERDVVLVADPVAQADGDGDAAKAAAEHERPLHRPSLNDSARSMRWARNASRDGTVERPRTHNNNSADCPVSGLEVASKE